MRLAYEGDLVTVFEGDCVDVMRSLPECSVDAVVTDPPYGLEFMGKEWDRLGNIGQASHQGFTDGSGFKGFRLPTGYNASANVKCERCAKWRFDHVGRKCECGPDAVWPNVKAHQGREMQEWHQAWATEALRVLKPGGHLLAFGGTRTWHRLACAIEDAGFEVRDSIAWQHSTSVFCRCSAVPYIHDPDDVRGVREAVHDARGMGETGQESDVLAPMQRQGAGPRVGDPRSQGSSELDGREPSVVPGEDVGRAQPRMEGRRDVLEEGGQLPVDQVRPSAGVGAADGAQGRLHHGASAAHGDDLRPPADAVGGGEPHQPRPAGQQPDESGAVPDQRGPQAWRGWPICYGCGKPLEPPFHPGPLAWQYGSGFPKSLDVSKAIDKAAGAERGKVRHPSAATAYSSKAGNHRPWMDEAAALGYREVDGDTPVTPAAQQWQGWGTALKPAFEPIVVARKPLTGTVAANVLAHGTGALNIDGCRVAGEVLSVPQPAFGVANGVTDFGSGVGRNGEMSQASGRWPANVILDEHQADALDRQSGDLRPAISRTKRADRSPFTTGTGELTRDTVYDDTGGGASRFFYTAKAGSAERPRVNGVAHPTVKPLDLMRWLVRLVTPPGGVVLEPFAGSGTTAEACIAEGFPCIAIEREPTYLPLILARVTTPTEAVLL